MKNLMKLMVIMMALMVGVAFTAPETFAATAKRPARVKSVKIVTKTTSMNIKYKSPSKIKVGKKKYKIKYRITYKRAGANKVTRTSKKSITLTKLKKNTKYTIFVRAYYKKGKKTLYSKSVIREVKTKKGQATKPTPAVPTIPGEGKRPISEIEYQVVDGVKFPILTNDEANDIDFLEKAYSVEAKAAYNKMANFRDATSDCLCSAHFKEIREMSPCAFCGLDQSDEYCTIGANLEWAVKTGVVSDGSWKLIQNKWKLNPAKEHSDRYNRNWCNTLNHCALNGNSCNGSQFGNAFLYQCTRCKALYVGGDMYHVYGDMTHYQRVERSQYQLPFLEYPEGNPEFEKLVKNGTLVHSVRWKTQNSIRYENGVFTNPI